VRINAAGYDDKDFVNDIVAKGKDIENKAVEMEKEILEIVNERIGM
jgi:glutamate formiminotransferase/formiminotetrahydrofolate cyclodeaminase